jgi:hypothetical protein
MRTSLTKQAARLLIWAGVCLSPAARGEGEVRFNRDVRPVLSRHCFACHGPDEKKRKAKLRLDVREAALEAGAIIPGNPEGSELVRRLDCEDADELMPPPEGGGEPLTDAQKDLLRRWVAAGAEYEPHWAWVAPVKPEPPEPVAAADFPIRNEIDTFTLAEMRERGWEPAGHRRRGRSGCAA